MSASASQSAEDLRNLMDSLNKIIDQLNSSTFEVADYELSVTQSDLRRVTFNLECAVNLGAGE